MASVLATISEMLIISVSSLKVIFAVVTVYTVKHIFQARKGDKFIQYVWEKCREMLGFYISEEYLQKERENDHGSCSIQLCPQEELRLC